MQKLIFWNKLFEVFIASFGRQRNQTCWSTYKIVIDIELINVHKEPHGVHSGNGDRARWRGGRRLAAGTRGRTMSVGDARPPLPGNHRRGAGEGSADDGCPWRGLWRRLSWRAAATSSPPPSACASSCSGDSETRFWPAVRWVWGPRRGRRAPAPTGSAGGWIVARARRPERGRRRPVIASFSFSTMTTGGRPRILIPDRWLQEKN